MLRNKEVRLRVWNKYGKKCSYCGVDLEYKKMQVDHINPIYRGYENSTLEKMGVLRGEDCEDNYNPSCARCNRWKKDFSLEHFRYEISKQTERLFRDSNQYRMALDFKMIELTNEPIIFWFEKYNKYENREQESDRTI